MVCLHKHREMQPSVLLWSTLKGLLKPSRTNWSTGIVSSSFISEILVTLASPLTCEASLSNLFLTRLMLVWTKTSLFKLFFVIAFKVHYPFLVDSFSWLSDMLSIKDTLTQIWKCSYMCSNSYKMTSWKFRILNFKNSRVILP